MTTKLCENCKFFKQSPSGREFATCQAPQNYAPFTSIFAAIIPAYRFPYCTQQRRDGWFWSLIDGKCGRGGRWFMTKENQP